MLSPLPDHCPGFALAKWRPKSSQLQSFWQRFFSAPLRIYFFSGLTKLLGSGMVEWGESLARLNSPSFRYGSSEVLIHGKYLFIPLGWEYACWRPAIPFIWRAAPANLARRHHRHAWRDCCVEGLYLFGLIMAVLNVAAFGNRSLPSPMVRGDLITLDD